MEHAIIKLVRDIQHCDFDTALNIVRNSLYPRVIRMLQVTAMQAAISHLPEDHRPLWEEAMQTAFDSMNMTFASNIDLTPLLQESRDDLAPLGGDMALLADFLLLTFRAGMNDRVPSMAKDVFAFIQDRGILSTKQLHKILIRLLILAAEREEDSMDITYHELQKQWDTLSFYRDLAIEFKLRHANDTIDLSDAMDVIGLDNSLIMIAHIHKGRLAFVTDLFAIEVLRSYLPSMEAVIPIDHFDQALMDCEAYLLKRLKLSPAARQIVIDRMVAASEGVDGPAGEMAAAIIGFVRDKFAPRSRPAADCSPLIAIALTHTSWDGEAMLYALKALIIQHGREVLAKKPLWSKMSEWFSNQRNSTSGNY